MTLLKTTASRIVSLLELQRRLRRKEKEEVSLLTIVKIVKFSLNVRLIPSQLIPLPCLTASASSVGAFRSSAGGHDSEDDSEDEEFGARKRGGSGALKRKSSTKTKGKGRASNGRGGMSIEDYEASRISSRNGKMLPNYNEDAMDLDLEGDEEDDADDPFEDKKDLRREIRGETGNGECMPRLLLRSRVGNVVDKSLIRNSS